MKATACEQKRLAAKPARKKPTPMRVHKRLEQIGEEKLSYTMKIHESLDRIIEKKLCDMTLFELSIRGPITGEAYRELRNRLMLLQASLEVGDAKSAKALVGSLLGPPPENPLLTRRKA